MKKILKPFLAMAVLLLIVCAEKKMASKESLQPIASGYDVSYVLRAGTLWAWGSGTYGQLGNGMVTDQTVPMQIGVDSIWVRISAGLDHTLGLKSDGTLWAWGFNKHEQLGDGTDTNRTRPVQIGIDTNWINISAGGFRSLGLKSDGTLWEWGWDFERQNRPTQIGTDNKWGDIAAGGNRGHRLGLKSDGTLWGWGLNDLGQLGNGTTESPYDLIRIGTDSNWVKIVVYDKQSFGLKSDGTLWAWGDNYYGNLGIGNPAKQILSPVQVGVDNKWVNVSVGNYYTLGLKSDGTLWAWGGGGNNGCCRQLLGTGMSAIETSPVQVGTDNKWLSIAAGYRHSLGLKSDGTLWSWGCNRDGQLGDGTTTNQINPVQIGEIKKGE